VPASAEPLLAAATVLVGDRRIPVPEEGLTIGRMPDSGLVIEGEGASRHHARVFPEAGGYKLVDLGSKNGTQLNGERFRDASRRLASGDEIVIGGETLRFLAGQATRKVDTQDIVIATQTVRFAGDRLTVGRDPTNGLVLDHPAVSRFHAELTRTDGRLELRDLGSRNGTRVDGQPVRAAALAPTSEIGVGPYRLVLEGATVLVRSEQGALRLEAARVTQSVKGKQILQETSIAISPGEFVAIIGESGSGKTTLMKMLAGVTEPASGAVTVNGEPVTGRLSDIGYLPQDEIVHGHLTVYESLTYSARLRLPSDTPQAEIEATVARVADELDLHAHVHTRIASLSGGQRKRVGVATELLSRPSLVFLDEPTTGLDPGLESKLMRLFRDLARNAARAVVLVTHATKNLGVCDRLIVMGRGGLLCFEGTPQAALRFFGAETFDDIYEALDSGAPDEWQRKFDAEGHPRSASAPRGPAPAPVPRKAQPRGRTLQQAGVLTGRYAVLTLRDTRNVLILVGQVPILAAAIIGLFGSGVFDRTGGDVDESVKVLFLIVVTSVWLGSIDAAREVIKEKSVFVRESAVGVRLSSYVMSKAIILFVLAAVQTVALAAIIFAFLPLDEPPQTYLVVIVILLVTAFAAVGTGLAVSAAVRTEDQATSFIPLALIPQLFFGGLLVPVATMSPPLEAISKAVVVTWAYAGVGEAIGANERIAANSEYAKVSRIGDDFFAVPQMDTFIVLGGFVVVLFALTALLLTRRAEQ